MLIKLPRIGKGTQDDPFRVDLPTYQEVAESPDGKYVIVEVPSVDFPTMVLLAAVAGETDAKGQSVITALPVHALTAWHKHLQARYGVLADRFSPDPSAAPVEELK